MGERTLLRWQNRWFLMLALAAIGVAAVVAATLKLRCRAAGAPREVQRHDTSGPLRLFRDHATRITICRPRMQVFDFLRNVQNWQRVVESLRAVEPLGDDRWRLKVGVAHRSFDIRVTENRHLGQIAWRSEGNEALPVKGCINLYDMQNREGTELIAQLVWRPPGGSVGQPFVSLVSRKRGLRELQRLKVLLESSKTRPVRDGLWVVG
jgi:uncharacterized membrane protein